MKITPYNDILTAIALDKRFEGFSNLSEYSKKMIVYFVMLKAVTLIHTSCNHTLDTAIDYWEEIIKGNIDILTDIEQELDERGDL